MATQTEGCVPENSSLLSEDRQNPILPNQPVETSATSYEIYHYGCVRKNQDRPDLVTPDLINAAYLGWLLHSRGTAPDLIETLYAEKDSAHAFRLWCENEGRKAGYASRYGFKQFGLGQWVIARNDLLWAKTSHRRVFRIPNVRRTLRASKRMETTNYIYDLGSGKVFVLPAFHKIPLPSIVFEEFRDAVIAINSVFHDAGILSLHKLWRIFRALLETAFAFEHPEVIEAALEHARKCTIRSGCLNFDTLKHPVTLNPITEWEFDMILIPHCVRYSQSPPPYEEFCRATQAVNPFFVISEELMKEAWTAVFDCRYELKNMTRKAADQAIATASSPYAKLFWHAAARIDAESPPNAQKRPTVDEYDSLFNFIHPTYPANRMIRIEKVGKGLIIPLSQPSWCLRPVGKEFASFTTFIEWLNPGITRQQVVGTWLGLGWSGTGSDSRVMWARQQTVDSFAPKHWGAAAIEDDKLLLEQEAEVGIKMAEMNKAHKTLLVGVGELPGPSRARHGSRPSAAVRTTRTSQSQPRRNAESSTSRLNDDTRERARHY